MTDCVITPCHVLSFLAAENISLTPSFGTVHTGGFVVIAGLSTNAVNSATAATIKFGDDGVELNCNLQMGRAIVICPVPLFSPDDTGVKTVTLTMTSARRIMPVCTHVGQYRVGKQCLGYVFASCHLCIYSGMSSYRLISVYNKCFALL